MLGPIMNTLDHYARQPLKASILNFDGPDMIIVLVIVLLLFGPKNLPKLARSIGSSVKELKNGLHGMTDEEKETPGASAEQQHAKTETPSPAPASTVTSEAKKGDDSHTTTV